MLEADLNLKRSMTIHQGIEKILAPYHKLYRKKATMVPTTLDKLLQINKTL